MKAAQKVAPAGRTSLARGFTPLEQRILLSKGLSEQQLGDLYDAGVRGKQDFQTVGDATTLAEISGLPAELAEKVMLWALGQPAAAAAENEKVVVHSADAVVCVHCGALQPKDHKSGDMCVACGKQAEPVMACFWCGGTGPGKFCRQCGAEVLPTAELELGILLKREGVAKGEIPEKLRHMTQAEKDVLWGRARRY